MRMHFITGQLCLSGTCYGYCTEYADELIGHRFSSLSNASCLLLSAHGHCPPAMLHQLAPPATNATWRFP
jgi:hypothetical protein